MGYARPSPGPSTTGRRPAVSCCRPSSLLRSLGRLLQRFPSLRAYGSDFAPSLRSDEPLSLSLLTGRILTVVEYRRLGSSELVVSEVGFGAWTIATDWWGKVDDKAGLVHAALDAGVTFFDTAPVYGDDGFGEKILAEILGRRDDVVVTTKVGYDIDAPRIAPGHSERPQDWRPESVRSQVEASLRRLGRDHIDLLQLHNVRIEPVQDDELWDELERLQAEGKVRELGVALGPAIGWLDEGLDALRNRPIATLQTVFNLLEQEPGRTFAAEPAVTEGRVGLIARVPHASDVLSGKVTRHDLRGRRPPRPPQAREPPRPLRQGRRTDVPARCRHRPHDRPGRGGRHSRHRRLHHGAAHVRDHRRGAGVRRRADRPLSADEAAEVEAQWRRQLRRHRPLRDAPEEQRLTYRSVT